MITGTINSITQLKKRTRAESMDLTTKLRPTVRKGSEEQTVYYSYMLGGTSIVPSTKSVFVKSIHATSSPKPTISSQFSPGPLFEKLKEDKLDI